MARRSGRRLMAGAVLLMALFAMVAHHATDHAVDDLHF